MGKLASFGRFFITASFMSSISLATGSWLLTTSHAPRPHATRATYRRDQRGQAVRRPSRWLLHATDRRIGKASWLNQADLLVAAFEYHYLKRASWGSREEFIAHVLASAPEYNQLYAHPFEWTWTNQKMRQWFAKHAP